MHTPESACLPTAYRSKPEDRQAEGQPTGLHSEEAEGRSLSSLELLPCRGQRK